MMLKYTIAVLLIFQFTLEAAEMLLLGFNGKRAPSIEKTFDKMMREELMMIPGTTLIDIERTRQLNRYIDFPENEFIAATHLESLRKYLNDSLYIVWGTLHEIVIEPKRRQFIKAQFSGRMQVDLHIYDFVKKQITYTGTLTASTSEDRGLIFISPVKTSYHIGAAERTRITEMVVREAVRVCHRVITATVSSDKANVDLEHMLEQNSASNLKDSTKNPSKSTSYNNTGSIPQDTIPNAVSPVATDTSISKQEIDTAGLSKQIKTP